MFSVDIEPDLVDLARARLADLGYHPTLRTADGADGLAEHAPFDRVIVRHEALCNRVEVRDLHRLAVAAAGMKLRAA